VTVCGAPLTAFHLIEPPVEMRTVVGDHDVPMALTVFVSRPGVRGVWGVAIADVAIAKMRIAAAAAATIDRTERVRMWLHLPGS
jgi:hypothetical protein